MPNQNISQYPLYSPPARSGRLAVFDMDAFQQKYVEIGSFIIGATKVIAPLGSGLFADAYTTSLNDHISVQNVINSMFKSNLTFSGLPNVNDLIYIGRNTSANVYTFVASRVSAFQVTIGATPAATAANFVSAFNSDNTNSGLIATLSGSTVVFTGSPVTIVELAANVTYIPLGGGDIKFVGYTADNYLNFGGGVTMCSNLTFKGEGIGRTIIKYTTTADIFSAPTVFSPTNSGSNPVDTFKNIKFFDLEFDGQSAGATPISTYSCSNLRVERCHIHHNVGFGIYTINGNNLWMKDNIIHDITTFAGIEFKGAANAWAIGNHVYNITGGGGGVAYGIDSHASGNTYGRQGQQVHILFNDVENATYGILSEDDDAEVIGNTVLNCWTNGISVEGTPDSVIVAQNTIKGTGSSGDCVGLNITGGTNVKAERNIVKNINSTVNSDGILVTVPNVDLTNNFVSNSGRYGVFVRANGVRMIDNRLFDDQTVHTQQNGIMLDVNVTDTEIKGNFLDKNTNAGIRLFSANHNTKIRNNTITNNNHGIQMTNTASNNGVLEDNSFSGNTTDKINGAFGTGWKTGYNSGYVTENSGTTSITSGNTSVVVNHGLDVTPNVKDISVSLSANPTNDPGNIWISNITSTQFTINCRNNPGASNLSVGWRAIVL